MDYIVRKATLADLDSLMKVFEDAKAIMRASGNLHQWNDGYPSEGIIRNDIMNENCYVVYDDDTIIGTMALIPGPDPTYEYIEGNWYNENPYYVIHRIATSAPGRNVARTMFEWAFTRISYLGYDTIRIDTHRDNSIMKHILNKNGFSECGVIYLKNGDPRDAYLCCKPINNMNMIPDWAKGMNCAVTVCDKEGVILYMNDKAKETFSSHGDLIGKSLIPCHNEHSRKIITDLLATGGSNAYTIHKNGMKKMIYQTAWKEDGEVAGLVEISMVIPDDMPHYVR